LPVGALEQEELRAAARTLGLDAAYFEIRRRKISRRPFAEERSAVLVSANAEDRGAQHYLLATVGQERP